MRFGICAAVMMMVFAGSAFAEYQFRITTERTAGAGGLLECTNWRAVVAEFELDQGVRKQYAKAPDENCISTTDLQEWFVRVESAVGEGYYLVTFLASVAGLEIPKKGALQYWFEYSKDGVVWSPASGMVLMRPSKPVGK